MKHPQPGEMQAKPDSGLGSLTNTAGELEREACSRRANLVEALVVMFLLLVALWGVAYPLAVLERSQAAGDISQVLVLGLLAFATLISPRLHHDSLKSWGLGSPKAFLDGLRRQRGLGRWLQAVLFLVATVFLTFDLARIANGTARFVTGIEPILSFRVSTCFPDQTGRLGCCTALSLSWALFIIRYDNFWSAAKAAGCMFLVMAPMMVSAALLTNGPRVFVFSKLITLTGRNSGYVFWGAVQQLLFCSYFGTRLRKGFGPAIRPGRRLGKRLGVAMVTGLFFALAHVNCWLLVGTTWVLGTVTAWLFMQDRLRNLQAMGLLHGTLATCVLWLFYLKPARVRVRFAVGPWSMPQHLDLETLLVVGTAIAGLGCAAGFLVLSSVQTHTGCGAREGVPHSGGACGRQGITFVPSNGQ